ncbi:WD40 repeat domain-containing protein [Okeania sp. SIO1F9]|uniref:WD40 repeat domain-containing protein n=1 Tax=Okeania sp. SIO1F9 TaxID=2607813 RepID=UPI00144BF436|nr:WD40 repeat domain-containing protein [Okeania sp. SIO1F9]NET74617.1 hypothetical protein [Okeania sp. SIO1F9]
MTNPNKLENLSHKNQNSLQELAFALEAEGKNFSLILARCNFKSLQHNLIQILANICSLKVQQLNLEPSAITLYTTIEKQIGNEQFQALMVLGLESVKEISRLLPSANQIRGEFSDNFHFPLVLWVTDNVLAEMIRLAPDFYSWAVTIDFEASTNNVVDFIRSTSEDVYRKTFESGNIFLGKDDFDSCTDIQLKAAFQELLNGGVKIESELEASLEFALGRLGDDLEESRQHYERSLELWKQNNNLVKQGYLSFYLGLWWRDHAEGNRQEYQHSCLRAKDYFQECIDCFEFAQRSDLVDRFINYLAEVNHRLLDWDELEKVAEKALNIHQNHQTKFRMARTYGFLAEVKSNRKVWHKTQELAEQALSLLAESIDEISNDSEKTNPVLDWELHYHKGWYLFSLAKAQKNLEQVETAVTTLEEAKSITKPSYDPELYRLILKELGNCYFHRGDYLRAFNQKLEQQEIETQFSIKAFIGAGKLQPRKHRSNPVLSSIQASKKLTQEIATSGRLPDVDNLVGRIKVSHHRFTILYGSSGVGKSSLVEAGLIPILKGDSVDARDILPVLQQVYTNWRQNLGDSLAKAISELENREYNPPTLERGTLKTLSNDDLLSILRALEKQNKVTVLIFDQFEEFFFNNKDINQRLQFYDFLQECLKISFVNVIISLREDFINYLLECNRLVSLDIINNDILSKKHIYYIGDFSIENAKSVIQGITSQTTFTLDPELIDELVKDLAGNLNTVRPIELQIVGSQLQNENINNLVEYQKKGPKQAFVGRYLEEVIKYCGPENERLAKVVLYFLTDENNTRPLKSRVELEEYTEKPERMELILTVLVESRLVFRIPAIPSYNYQLVHDYLAYFVRKEMSEAAQISAELEKERELRKQTEKMLNDALRKQLNAARRAAITLGGMLLTIGGVAVVATLVGINTYLSGLSAASKDNTELDRLVSAIEAGKKLKWLSFGATPGTKLQVLSELSTAIQKVKEFNRFEKHKDDVTHVSFSNDEKMIATGSKDDSVKVWSVDGSQEEKTFDEHTDDITQVDFSSDGKIVASASKDNSAVVRWLDDSRESISLPHNEEVLDVSFSSDNQFVATGCKDGKVQIWSVKDGSLVKTFDSHTAPVAHVSFSPNGKIVASADNYDNVKLWFIDEEKEVEIDNYATTDIEFIDDETIIFSSRGNDFKIYKVNGELIKRYGESLADYTHNIISNHRMFIVYVDDYNQNYAQILTRSNYHTYLRYLYTFQHGNLKNHSENISHLSFSPYDKFIISASEDDTVILWKIDNFLKIFDYHSPFFFLHRKNSFDKSLNADIVPINTSLKKIEIQQQDKNLITTIIVPHSYVFSFSRNNQNFITNSDDYSYTPKLWNTDKKEIALQKNTGYLKNIKVSPDAKTVAAINNNNIIQLWNNKGFPLKILEHNQVKKLAFSPDSQIIASVSFYGIKIWSNEGELIAELDGDYQKLQDIFFSPDSQVITVICDNQGIFLNRSGKLINSFDGHNEKIEKILLSQDKQIIATQSYNQVKLWNLNGKLIKDLGGHHQKVEKVIFSPDSQIIASIGDDNFAKIWRRNGTYAGKLEHRDQVESLDFSLDSKIIITLSYNPDREENSVINLWQSDGTLMKPYQQINDPGINNIELNPAGNIIVSTSGNIIKLWNLDGNVVSLIKGHYGEINDVKFSPDGEIIATASDDKTIKLWNEDGKEIKTLRGHKYPVQSIEFSPDGNFFASIDDDDEYSIDGEKTIIFWDKEGNLLKKDVRGDKVRFQEENNSITSITSTNDSSECETLIFWQLDGKKFNTPQESKSCDEFSKILDYSYDRQTIAWGKTEYPLKLWSLDGKLIRTFKGHSAWVNSATFNHDGTKIVSASDDKTIKIWHKDGQLLNTIKEKDIVKTASFSPDGKTILSGGDEKILKLWSLDGELINPPFEEIHTDKIIKATFSPDGKKIASVSENNNVIIWNVNTREHKEIKNSEEVKSISFSPNSDILTIEHEYGKVTLHLLNGIFVTETELYTTNSFLGEKFSPDGKAIAVQNQSGVLLLNADLDDLLNRACNWASAYLKTTENEDIKHLCD